MVRLCPKCNEQLVKGFAYKSPSGPLAVRFDKTVKYFEEFDELIMSPYVCKKCGFIEWYVDRTDLL